MMRRCKVIVCQINEDNPAAIGNIVNQYVDIHEPEIMVLLGDRWETLGAAYIAACWRIPICHIHGGESTWGAMDDSMRHAISKLSHIHCVANTQFAETLRRMGERNIYITGAPGLDNLRPIIDEVPSLNEAKKNNSTGDESYFVCTYHPETLGDDTGLTEMIEAIKKWKRIDGDDFYWTGVNNDPESDAIRNMIESSGAGEVVEWSLTEYLTRCRKAWGVVGNSSSGIIEAPYLGVPTVNIGQRQAGRPMGRSIYNPDDDRDSIYSAFIDCMSHGWAGDDMPCRGYDQLYGSIDGQNSAEIAQIIASVSLKDILRKPWHI